MLELDGRGDWHVHAETFEAHLRAGPHPARRRPAPLSRVQLYNANLKYLLNALVLGGRLGDAHRESAELRRPALPPRLLRPGAGSWKSYARRSGSGSSPTSRMTPRSPRAGSTGRSPPGDWALRNPLVVAGQYAGAYRKLQAGARPRDAGTVGWELHDDEWGAFYGQFLDRVEPLEPDETKVMKTLVDDFIARGRTSPPADSAG